MRRTHYCGEIRLKDAGKEVSLCGWVQRRRDHGGLIFIDLRDRSGISQIVFSPDTNPAAHNLAGQVRNEYVLAVNGKVRPRPEGTINPNLPTGEVEVEARTLEILNPAQTPPFLIEDDLEIAEEVRLKYRYLDLRRPKMQHYLQARHKICLATRRYMDEQGFIEIETPALTKSTPEGARDFLVPSRLSPGNFYALPQSPQLFKQLLMVSGVDKYFQVVKCYRDEDLRADRQPEFTQIDIEMSFADEEDVFKVTEGLMEAIFYAGSGIAIKTPFSRLTYADTINRYGSDKPDTRFGMELIDVFQTAQKSEFRVFLDAISSGGQVKGIVVPHGASFSRSELDSLTDFVKTYGAKGLAWIKVVNGQLESPITKFFSREVLDELKAKMEAKDEDLVLFVADKPKVVADSLAQLRLKLGNQLGLIDKSRFDCLWIIDFPLFQWNEEEGRFNSEHHPFTAPKEEQLPLLDEDPGKVLSRSYDLVINGNERASGSVRIHRREIQEKIFNILKLKPEEIQLRFGFFLDALQYGTPPHAGIAPGLDRLVEVITGAESMRDVIAFPKTQKGTCMVTGAPAEVSAAQLKELFIKADAPKQ